MFLFKLFFQFLSGVEALAHGCPKLRSFMCSGCVQLNDVAISVLAEHCPNLEVVNLFGCNVRMITLFKNLAYLCVLSFILFFPYFTVDHR